MWGPAAPPSPSLERRRAAEGSQPARVRSLRRGRLPARLGLPLGNQRLEIGLAHRDGLATLLFDLAGRSVLGLLEFLLGLPEGLGQLGEPRAAEQQQDDDQDDDEFRRSEVHTAPKTVADATKERSSG